MLGFLFFIFHWKSYICFCWKEVQVCSSTEVFGWYNAIREFFTYLCFLLEVHVVVNQIFSETHGCYKSTYSNCYLQCCWMLFSEWKKLLKTGNLLLSGKFAAKLKILLILPYWCGHVIYWALQCLQDTWVLTSLCQLYLIYVYLYIKLFVISLNYIN